MSLSDDAATFAVLIGRTARAPEGSKVEVSQTEFAALCRLIIKEFAQPMISIETVYLNGRRLEVGIR